MPKIGRLIGQTLGTTIQFCLGHPFCQHFASGPVYTSCNLLLTDCQLLFNGCIDTHACLQNIHKHPQHDQRITIPYKCQRQHVGSCSCMFLKVPVDAISKSLPHTPIRTKNNLHHPLQTKKLILPFPRIHFRHYTPGTQLQPA